MVDGIRVEVQVSDLESCPIVAASERTGLPITTISRSEPDETATITEEFTTDSDVLPIDVNSVETVFETDRYARHRFSHRGENCVCRTIELTGSPVEAVQAERGVLTVSFYARNVNEVGDIVSKLQERFEDVSLQRLHQATGDGTGTISGGDLVWVDRDALTNRQREVLQTAHGMGYFEYPRETNATEVAAAIGIAPSTFSEHLTLAQSTILESVLSE